MHLFATTTPEQVRELGKMAAVKTDTKLAGGKKPATQRGRV
jgi:hypothetical protein